MIGYNEAMNYLLAYGRGTISVDLPEKNVVKVLNIQSAAVLPQPIEEVRRKLKTPNGSKPLAEIAAGKKSACIVICDITRPVPNQIVLPPILQTLENAGIADQEIVILVATGLHRASTTEEKLEMLGKNIVNRYRIEDHNARNRDEHDYLGESQHGVPIWIDRRYLNADVKILTGLIEPHFMAGFSGGRKSICPGIAAAETIGPWHSPRFLEHDNARFGCIENNPVHEEQLEIAIKSGCDFIVNVVIDHHRDILAVVAGDMDQAHREGVGIARQFVTDTVEKPVDVVITSAAGYPLDKTWYQSIKGIIGAVEILKPGGTIILAAACDEGLGSKEFEEIANRFPTIESFINAILANQFFVVDQWQIEELAKALRKGKVKVVSDGLPPEVFRKYYVTPSSTVEQAVAEAIAEYGQHTTIAVMPDGPYVLAEIK
ncbi:MAG: nickel-dependent lactate racemase [Planctomycetaceae bacterium]|jgi:nickel-dependent lactate racemase|nr:nickel-dependent lactate racemase [Planctomycetaceae bacterium]